jgi:hypothetical protein
LDAVVDEGVQIHGGCGYIQEYKIERLYRDSRINRIFEGTNEINRLLIPATLLKRALKGELPLIARVQELQRELLQSIPLAPLSETPLMKQTAIVTALKKVFLMVGGLAMQKHGLLLEREQEIVASLADLMIDLYALESTLLRTRKLVLNNTNPQLLQLPMDMTTLFAEEAVERAGQRARALLAALETGESLRLHLSVLKRLLRFEPADLTVLRKRISTRVISAESYALL